MKTAVAERRKYRRYDLSLEVHLRPRGKRGGTPIRSQTRDISARGVYFDVVEAIEVGTDLEFEVNLPPELSAGRNVRIRCHGRVVRVDAPDNEGGMGVAATIESYEFVAVPPREKS